MFASVRHAVFWPTFIVLVAAVVTSAVNRDGFFAIMSTANTYVLDKFAWLYSLSGLYVLVLGAIVYFSPLGKIRIGGEHATPLITKRRWFFITLCTTLAVGILFWTTAEPLYHLMEPPVSAELEPGSPAAARFAMATMFVHWAFTPYAIYAIPSLVFALVFYNRRDRLSIASMLAPLFGPGVHRYASVIDAVALYALVLGMASSLGTGGLSISGGISQIIGGTTTPARLALVIGTIVVVFVLSAASGLQKGIARLSTLNAWLLLALGLFTLVVGPTVYMLGLGTESFGVFIDTFFTKSVFTGTAANDPWANDWTVFYWAVWFAWAPMAALFLGKISRGYTVRQFIQINLIFPALFAIVWVTIFGGLAIYEQLIAGSNPYGVLSDEGIEMLLYTLFRGLPLSWLWIPLLVVIAFVSYVTAADSQTDAIGNLCTKGVTADSDLNTGIPMNVVWGGIFGTVSWVMVSFVGVDGVRMLSNLGGLPSMVIVLVSSSALWIWMRKPELLTVAEDMEAEPLRELTASE